MAEVVQHKVNVVVWTPCSILMVGFLAMVGLGLAMTMCAPAAEPPTETRQVVQPEK